MSSSGAYEVGAEEMTQDIREQWIVNQFDYFTTQGGPHRGVVILRFLGFGVVTLVGIDPNVVLSYDSQVGSPEIPKIGIPTTLKGQNFLCKPPIEVRF